MTLTEPFYEIDDFCQMNFPAPRQAQLSPSDSSATSTRKTKHRRRRAYNLSLSESMTIIIHFHQSRYRTFKDYYIKEVLYHLHREFPNAVSYNRFVELQKIALIPLCSYLQTKMGRCTGLSFIDSTPISVCLPQRGNRHKVFKGTAAWGKNSVGWFFGFKLHIIINDCGELLAVSLTPGNTDDRVPVEQLTKDLFGKMFGDKGYISQALFQTLFGRGIELFTRLRKNMKNKLMRTVDRVLLRKRAIIESVNDQLKNISMIEHSRHRSPLNFMVNLVSGLIAYCLQPKKPSLNFSMFERSGLPTVL